MGHSGPCRGHGVPASEGDHRKVITKRRRPWLMTENGTGVRCFGAPPWWPVPPRPYHCWARAKEAGLSAVAKQQIGFEGSTVWVYYGGLDSFKLGRHQPAHHPGELAGDGVGRRCHP